jgi:hypothetical protein
MLYAQEARELVAPKGLTTILHNVPAYRHQRPVAGAYGALLL